MPLGSRAAGLGGHGATTLKNEALQPLQSGLWRRPLARTGSWHVWGIPVLPEALVWSLWGLALSGCRLRRRTFQQSQEAGVDADCTCFRRQQWGQPSHRQVGRAGGGWASESCGRGGSGSGLSVLLCLHALPVARPHLQVRRLPPGRRPRPPTGPGAPGQAVHGGALN